MHGNSSGQTQLKTFNNDFSNKKTHSGARRHNANKQGRKKNEAQEQREFFTNKPQYRRGKLISAFTSRKDSDP